MSKKYDRYEKKGHTKLSYASYGCRKMRPTCKHTLSAILTLLFLQIFVFNARSLAQPEASKEEILSSIKLDYTWAKSWLSRNVKADFTVQNQSPFDIKDIEITCAFLADSGTQFGSGTTKISDAVLHRATRKFDARIIGDLPYQATCVSCKVVDFSLCQPAIGSAQDFPEGRGAKAK
ncbi:MAG: hypothetical protein ABSF90_08570 [Syntrophobacteraceae bacterium]